MVRATPTTAFARITSDPTPKIIAEALIKQLVGWPGLKGEAEATAGRASYGKVYEAALAPFKDKIEKIDYHDGEKSWIYTTVHLK